MKKVISTVLLTCILLSSNVFSEELATYYLQNSLGSYHQDKLYGAGFFTEFGRKMFKDNYITVSLGMMKTLDKKNKNNSGLIEECPAISFNNIGIDIKRYFFNQRVLAGVGIHDIAKHEFEYTKEDESRGSSFYGRFYHPNPSLSLSANIALFENEYFVHGLDVQTYIGKYNIVHLGYFIRF